MRYRDDVEAGLPELSEITKDRYGLWILKYDTETSSWKLTYDSVDGMTLTDPSLPWHTFYQRHIITEDTEEYFITFTEISTQESIPNTSDISYLNIALCTVSVIATITILIEKKQRKL